MNQIIIYYLLDVKTLLVLTMLMCSPTLFAVDHFRPNDTPCDTIKLTNGRIILGRIYYEDRTVVRYWHCNEAIKTKHEIAMFQVKEIGYGSERHNQPVVEDRARLNNRGIYWIVTLGVTLLLALLLIILLV